MFNEWLTKKLQEVRWSQADLSRYSGITTGAISNYINGRIPDKSALIKIAKALKVSPEIVFRAANILPQENPTTEIIQEITYLVEELPALEQQDILEFVKLRHNLAEKRKNETKRITKHSTITK